MNRIGIPRGIFALVATGVSALLIYRLVDAQTSISSPDQRDESARIRAFMALGSTKPAEPLLPKTKQRPHSPDCVPCAEKQAALAAGGVSSRRPTPSVDEPILRITGRQRTDISPSIQGTTTVTFPESFTAWVTLLHGLPFEQHRCHLQLSSTGMTVTALPTIAPFMVSWENPRPTVLGSWGTSLQKTAQVMWTISQSLPKTMTTGQTVGPYQVDAVTSQQIILKVQTSSPHQCDDLTLTLDNTGRLIGATHVFADHLDEPVQANRSIWWFIAPEENN